LDNNTITVNQVSRHVYQLVIPTPTLPPSFSTNSYVILGPHGSGLIIDSGTTDEAILSQQVSAAQSHGLLQVEGIMATHYHRDHTHGLPFLANHFQAPLLVHSLDLVAAAQEMGIAANHVQPLSTHYKLDNLEVRVEHHPGHTHGHVHIVIDEDQVVLVGDHLAGDSSVWIGPPDGHMVDYYAALNAIIAGSATIAAPGHGSVLQSAQASAMEIKQRRQAREQQIAGFLQQQPQTLRSLLQQMYAGTIPEAAMWVAKKTLQGHLQFMLDTNRLSRTFEETKQCFIYYPSHTN